MRLLLLAVAALVAVPALAQSLPGWAEPSPPSEPPPVEVAPDMMMAPPTGPPPAPSLVPIDGGLGLLALAGGAYAAARLRRREA